MTLLTVADVLDNGINPALTILILLEPALPRRQTSSEPRERWYVFWLRALVAIAVATVLAEAGKKYVIWPGHPWFPSGHMTYATAAAACLLLRRGPRWVALAAPVLALMGFSLVYAGWHSVEDVIGGLFLGAAVVTVSFRLLRR